MHPFERRPARLLRARAGCVILGAVVAVSTWTGCSAIQESLECPGDDCPQELQAVADSAAGVEGVTGVDRTWRFSNIDRGARGGVDVHADVATQKDAGVIARQVRDLYAASDVEPVDLVLVTVVPDPERSRAATADLSGAGDFSQGAPVACSTSRCEDEVATFTDAFSADPVADDLTLLATSWTDAEVAPQTTVELSAGDGVLDSDAVNAAYDRVRDLADRGGLFEIGYVRIVLHYRKTQSFEFSFDI